jgi:hypothetical protein
MGKMAQTATAVAISSPRARKPARPTRRNASRIPRAGRRSPS